MGTIISNAGLFSTLFLLVLMAYKGHSVIIIAPLVTIIAIVSSSGLDSHIMADYTEVYMQGFAGYVKNYFPLYLLGAIFAKIMEITGYADSIANFIASKLGKEKAVLSVVLVCGILTYGGVSMFVAVFVVLPIAVTTFMEADIPKRFMPATIAFGSMTFTMTALSGTPQVPNMIPMIYFGTDAFAAPILGLIAAAIMFFGGVLWLNYRIKKAMASGEGYGDYDTQVQRTQKGDTPDFVAAVIPIVIIIVVNLVCSKIIYPNINSDYLKQYGTVLSRVSGNWSVLIALFVSCVYTILRNVKRLNNLQNDLIEATNYSFAPLINSCAVVGFGSVVQRLAIFETMQDFVLEISNNPLISVLLSVNLFCGLTASASGGLGAALDALGPKLLDMGAKYNISPDVLHRVASVSSGCLDSLPHNGATITIIQLCGIQYSQSYFDMFMCRIVFPSLASIVIVILASLGVRC